jgi:heme-degrading monooxygenase HmoA
MAVLMEMEMQVTPDQYDAVDAALDPPGNPPDGLIAHTARFDGDTLKILDIWESADAFSAFAESRLGPTIGETLGDDAPDGPPQPSFTELHNAHNSQGL